MPTGMRHDDGPSRAGRRAARGGRPRAMRSPEALEPRVLLATFTVTNAGDGGPGSFRDAILAANNAPGADQIRFGFFAPDQIIQPSSPLPAVTGPTVIGSGS